MARAARTVTEEQFEFITKIIDDSDYCGEPASRQAIVFGCGLNARQKHMLRYRRYLLASDGRVNSRREYLAKDDPEAVELARAMYGTHEEVMSLRHGFEVWQGIRLVMREG